MTSWNRTVLTAVLSSWLLACGSGAGSASGSGSVAAPTPSGAGLSTATLKYRIIDAAGAPSLDCGPPLISSADEAKQRADAQAGVTRLGSDPYTLSAIEQRI